MAKRFESGRFESGRFELNPSDSGVFMLDPEVHGLLAGDDPAAQVDTEARFLEIARRLPKVRLDKVMKIRDEIAAGTYVTEEKMQATVERILRVMRGA